MCKCEDCINYDDENSYPGTGWCELFTEYVKQDDCCEEFTDE